MFRLFNTLLGVVKAKMMALWTKIRLWTSRSYWETKGVNTFRQFFSRLLNVKPRSQSDYYPVLRWLVSKRLAFALVVVLARFARDRMAPGEMERIAVPRVLLDKADAEQALVVEVQEETP